MNEWNKYCAARFELSKDEEADIRVAYQWQGHLGREGQPMTERDGGYWSYLGTDVGGIPKFSPTMMLEDFDIKEDEKVFTRVVRHETGHTLGFPHEHRRADIVNKLDRKKTIQYYGSTQGWSREDVIFQVLEPMLESALDGSEIDETSIMCYQIPGRITKDGKPIPGGNDLSIKDKEYSGKFYPKTLAPNWEASKFTFCRTITSSPKAATSANVVTINTSTIHNFARLALEKNKKWQAKDIKKPLPVFFMDTKDDVLKKRILSHMNEWYKYCAISFAITEDITPSVVRVAFTWKGKKRSGWK